MENITELTKELTVLYAEDEPTVREEMQELFALFFKKIITAKDGEEGLALYQRHQEEIDIVISDIEMPHLNGLEMVKQIRQFNSEVPVIITTAFNDQKYFLESINNRVDKYLLKPIEEEQMMATFYDVARSLHEKRMLATLLAQQQQAELKAREEETISKINDAYIAPVLIFMEGRLVHYSQAFADLVEELDSVTMEQVTVESTDLFDAKKGYLASLADYDEEDPQQNKVQITQKVGKRIYRVYRKSIELDSEAQVFVFHNITYEEYLKVKYESYAHALERMVIQNRVEAERSDEGSGALNEAVVAQEAEQHDHVKTIAVEEEKKTLLHKEHSKEALSATEFITTIDPYYLQELQELDDLDLDMKDAMLEFEEGDATRLRDISELLEKYAQSMYYIDEFKDLHVAIKSLSELLYDVDFSTVDPSKHRGFFLYMNSIREDLAYWRNNVFVEQNAIDVHYLDASLLSSTLQLEVLLSNEEAVVDEGDDLEFF